MYVASCTVCACIFTCLDIVAFLLSHHPPSAPPLHTYHNLPSPSPHMPPCPIPLSRHGSPSHTLSYLQTILPSILCATHCNTPPPSPTPLPLSSLCSGGVLVAGLLTFLTLHCMPAMACSSADKAYFYLLLFSFSQNSLQPAQHFHALPVPCLSPSLHGMPCCAFTAFYMHSPTVLPCLPFLLYKDKEERKKKAKDLLGEKNPSHVFQAWICLSQGFPSAPCPTFYIGFYHTPAAWRGLPTACAF